MKTRSILLVNLILLASIIPEHANALTGKALLEHLNSPELVNKAVAFGYIYGVEDKVGVTNLFTRGPNCIIQFVDLEQQQAIIKKYLEDHPEKWQHKATLLIEDALVEAFPCSDFVGSRQQAALMLLDAKKKRLADDSLKICQEKLKQCNPRAGQK